MAKTTVKELAEILERIQVQLAGISARVERLEAAALQPLAIEETQPAQLTSETQQTPEPQRPPITEEELIAISAALGAYLGVRVRIKQIRLLSSHAWAQQGRVSIQASHYLHN